MKIIILGAGVIGVTSAYILGERGYEVEVIDRHPDAASETSFANGGQLSFSHAEPWANPMVLSKVFYWMFKKDAPLVLRPRLDPHMLSWSLAFLRNCAKNRCDTNAMNLLRLGIYSKQVMEKIRVMSGIRFDNLREGILHIYTGEKDFQHAVAQAEFQNKASGGASTMEVLDKAGCEQKEPTLQHTEREIVGGVYCNMDESGDACTFTRRLAEVCAKEFGVKFSYGETVNRINTDKGRITSVVTDKAVHNADAYVMAMGSFSYVHLKKLGIKVPIYPMKGYSISVPAGNMAPTMSITDNENKVVISRLGDRLRAAGTAEFAGYNMDVKDARVEPITRATQSLFPHADYNEANMTKWACLRPSTPDGLPIIGKSPYDNLFLNTGHGTLGWTHAAGSANLLADIMAGNKTEIAMTGMTLDRY